MSHSYFYKMHIYSIRCIRKVLMEETKLLTLILFKKKKKKRKKGKEKVGIDLYSIENMQLGISNVLLHINVYLV